MVGGTSSSNLQTLLEYDVEHHHFDWAGSVSLAIKLHKLLNIGALFYGPINALLSLERGGRKPRGLFDQVVAPHGGFPPGYRSLTQSIPNPPAPQTAPSTNNRKRDDHGNPTQQESSYPLRSRAGHDIGHLDTSPVSIYRTCESEKDGNGGQDKGALPDDAGALQGNDGRYEGPRCRTDCAGRQDE